ncbi:hypothetical protein IMZ16_02500 [Cruoricaptor ignavus]|uniref:Uncharacterized protein n=1 Tax=Cruoricaptor ignavus TaxID=1118202 RepID=A0A7M1T3A1_9FLAO|nr:hypothetical protein [Cruoricaptor ignavus]QOR74330.1 hypothetical protein IMZ16_02500 [Cruoricaptor ignavus]
MKYTLVKRNKSTIAPDHRQFVTWMRRHDMQHFESNEAFMDTYAHRKATFEDIKLRHSSEEEFVEDLIAHGLLKIEETRKFGFFGNFS